MVVKYILKYDNPSKEYTSVTLKKLCSDFAKRNYLKQKSSLKYKAYYYKIRIN